MADDKSPNEAPAPEAAAGTEQSWAAQVIDLFGGPQKMAVSLDMAPSTIAKWREKGEIPEGRLKEIFDGAKAYDIELPPHPGLASGEDVRIAAHSRKPDDVDNILEDELPDPSSGVGFAVISSMVALVGVLTVPLWHGAYLDKLGGGDPSQAALDQIAELQSKLEEQAKEIDSLEKKLPKPSETPQYARNLQSRVDSLQNQMSNVQTRSNDNQNDINNLRNRVDQLYNYRMSPTAATTYTAPVAGTTWDDGNDDGTAAAMPDAMAGGANTDTTTYTMPPAIGIAPPVAPVAPMPTQVVQSGLTEASIISLNNRIERLRDRIEQIDDQADDAIEQIADIRTELAETEQKQRDAIENVIKAIQIGDERVAQDYLAADADIHRQISEVRSQNDAKLITQLNDLRDERNRITASLAESLHETEMRLGRIATRIDATEGNLTKDVEALRSRIDEVQEMRLDGHSLVIALNQLRARTQTSDPFRSELDAAIAVATDMPEVKASLTDLAPLADKGVPTHAVLKERFAAIAPKLMEGRARGESAGLWGTIKSNVASAVSARPANTGAELPEDASFSTRVSFAEARLEAGDLQGAYNTMRDVLPASCDPATQPGNECPPAAETPAWVEEVKKTLTPWLEAAGSRLKLDRVMTEVSKAGLARASR